uniref:HD domain-containing protein n=1 Tax=Micromonospora sp. 050-3 TaxID=2789265 RepID=UPI00397A12DC
MESRTAARVLAEQLLASALPRRWSHVTAVARKANQIGSLFAEADKEALVAAAWLHDIGYAAEVAQTGLHALDGARWLRRSEWDPRVSALVAYHSCAIYEAEERGLSHFLRSEFADEESAVRDALWYADMTTGPDGREMTALQRLAEVRQRYGPSHVVTRFWARAEPVLLAAVARTERLLQAG